MKFQPLAVRLSTDPTKIIPIIRGWQGCLGNLKGAPKNLLGFVDAYTTLLAAT